MKSAVYDLTCMVETMSEWISTIENPDNVSDDAPIFSDSDVKAIKECHGKLTSVLKEHLLVEHLSLRARL